MSQLSHYDTNFKERKFSIILLLDGVNSPANIGSLFRLSDAFSIEKIVLCGPKPDMKSNRLLRTARSTVEKVEFEEQEKTIVTLKKYREQSYTLLALEITEDSTSLDSFPFKDHSKIVLVIGNERTGIDKAILDLTDHRLHINMFGKNSSMNVAQATGIALYEITKSLPHI